MTDIYDRFVRMRRELKQYKSKKDLLRADKSFLKDYFSFVKFLGEDARLRPDNHYTQFKKYKQSGLKFKSHYLGINLSLNKAFDVFDRYQSSKKIIAIVTNAMVRAKTKLTYIASSFNNVDVAYKKTRRLKTIQFKIKENFNDSFDFFNFLPTNYYVNIDGTSYNKNGLDFHHDYLNQSNDFVDNLLESVESFDMFIYRNQGIL